MRRHALDPTFRDPAGSLSLEDDRAVRTIAFASREEVRACLAADFFVRAQADGRIVSSHIDETTPELRLLHPRVAIPSYPWEWTPAQWLVAAELTLDLCGEALADGWVLKDATPLNVLFVGSRPVFVDVLSFERHEPTSSIWLAYGQYVRTFLLPLLMHKTLRWPLGLSLFRRDGFEPSELYKALSLGQRLSGPAFWSITLPALLERRQGADAAAANSVRRVQTPEVARYAFERTLAGLRRRTRQAAASCSAPSEWSEYAGSLTHYTAAESERKRQWVDSVLDEAGPARVLDIGANTGEYSALAAGRGIEVVALERDEAAADRLAAMSQARGLSIQTIHADLARPTPAVGWDNRESSSLLDRLEGRFDLVLMLAVIHHLLLMEQIPLPAIVALCHRLTRRFLVVEWVPATDPMFQSLLRGRETLYGALSADDLLDACAGLFTTLRQETLGNGRTLFLFERLA